MLEPQPTHDRDRRGVPEQHRLLFGNRILDALPPKEAERLAPAMRRVFVQRDQVVVRPGEPIAFLHFPIDMFAWSWTESTDTQRPTSVMTIGQRGVVEWNRVLGTDHGNTCATVISPGAAWRLPADVFEQYQPQVNSPLRRLLLHFANASILNAACRLACNAEHNIDQRLARWLLWVADECGRMEFAITHQQIAEIAAIRRPSVSLALSQFQRDGLIRSQHGRLRVLERELLERMVCRCYWIIRNNADAVFKRESGA
jgi:Crp-like helix-turn-helix domain